MDHLTRLLPRLLFYKAFGHAVAALVLGVRVLGREHLPVAGPAILIANHNSHLDTLVLGAILPLRALRLLTPVAAGRYFMRRRGLAWFATHVVGILPVHGDTGGQTRQSLQRCCAALDAGRILIYYPEGTRGEPEVPSPMKSGIAALAERYPDVPMIPIHLSGLGHSLPKGGTIPLPVACQVRIGAPLPWTGSRRSYLHAVHHALHAIDAMVPTRPDA